MSRENFISFTINNLNTDGIYKSELITYALTILFFFLLLQYFLFPSTNLRGSTVDSGSLCVVLQAGRRR